MAYALMEFLLDRPDNDLRSHTQTDFVGPGYEICGSTGVHRPLFTPHQHIANISTSLWQNWCEKKLSWVVFLGSIYLDCKRPSRAVDCIMQAGEAALQA